MKIIFTTLLLISLSSFAQTSHQELCSELLKDLRQAISDSTQLPFEALQLYFAGNAGLDEYISRSISLTPLSQSTSNSVQHDSIKVEVTDLSLAINRKLSHSSRNSAYLRQLELSVLFFWNQNEYQWHGRVSDQLSKSGLKQLLLEEFPEQIKGDYLEDQPAFRLVLLTTLGLFSFVSALFFMRT